MFILVDGIMGSGKTYYAVNFIKENIDKYYKIYTNINGFKFNKFSNILPLYFDYAPDGSLSLLDYFQKLKEIYDTPDTDDNDLHQYLLDNDFIDSSKKPFLVVIDEAQNYFDKKTDLLIWMQTYHRHLFIDFILITQSASLLHSSYLKQFEYFIHSIPLSRQLTNSKFKYQKHISFPYRDGKYGTKVDTITLDKKEDIFSLYQSGDKVRVKSVLHKYIYYFAGFIVILIVFFVYLLGMFFSPPSKSKESSSLKKRHDFAPKKHLEDKDSSATYRSNSKYIRIKCFKYNCYGKSIKFDLRDLDFLVKYTGSRFLRSVTNGRYVEIYLIATQKFLDLFETKGYRNDKSFNFDPISSFRSSK